MICEECKYQNKKSTITEGLSTITSMYSAPFYDEEGKYHIHDQNLTVTDYRCSNGHIFRKSKRLLCPNNQCEWGT